MNQVLFLLFHPRLKLAVSSVAHHPDDSIDDQWYLDDELFTLAQFTFAAFYDWLHTAAGSIIGVRFWLELEPEVVEITSALIRLPYVRITHEGAAMEVLFSAEGAIDERLSYDQAFAPNPVFFGPHGQIAFAVHMADLTDAEGDSLQAAVWDTVSVRTVS